MRRILARYRVETARWTAFRSHFGIEAFYCQPGLEGAHEKGGVEGQIGWFRRNHLVPVPEVDSLDHPTVAGIRQAAQLLDDDVWIAVRLPGDFDDADDLDDGTAIHRWSTVVTHPDELGWLREALHLLDSDDQDDRYDEDDLESL